LAETRKRRIAIWRYNVSEYEGQWITTGEKLYDFDSIATAETHSAIPNALLFHAAERLGLDQVEELDI
jgi:hypothetical protein